MKANLLKTAAILLLLVAFFSSCEKSEFEYENEYEYDFGISIKTQYYWSGGQRIWLDTDYSTKVIRFDNEQSLNEYLSLNSTAFMLRPLIVIHCREPKWDREALQTLESNQSIVSMVFGNLFHNSDTSFWLAGNILFEPREGISADYIVQRFAADGEINYSGFFVSVEINDLRTIFDIANRIYKSGMVNWSHPNFWTPISLHQ